MCSVQLPHLLIIARLRFGIRVLQSNVWRFPSWPSAQGRNNNALSGVSDRIKDLDEKGSLSFGKYALVFQGSGFYKTKKKIRPNCKPSRAKQQGRNFARLTFYQNPCYDTWEEWLSQVSPLFGDSYWRMSFTQLDTEQMTVGVFFLCFVTL